MMNNSRRVKIASQLLSETPHETSISKLSERYFISSASIVNDLKIIESWIAPLGLTLIRSQSGTHIEGSESSVRQAMASLINGVINHNEPGCVIHSRLDPEVIKRWCITLVKKTFYSFSHYYRRWKTICAGHWANLITSIFSPIF
jgi:transcriptional antiterminator